MNAKDPNTIVDSSLEIYLRDIDNFTCPFCNKKDITSVNRMTDYDLYYTHCANCGMTSPSANTPQNAVIAINQLTRKDCNKNIIYDW